MVYLSSLPVAHKVTWNCKMIGEYYLLRDAEGNGPGLISNIAGLHPQYPGHFP
jgi:hypothetical protein